MVRLLIPVVLPLNIPGIGALTNRVSIELGNIPSSMQETSQIPNIEVSQGTTTPLETTTVESPVTEEGRMNLRGFVWFFGAFVITCYMIRSYVRDKKLLKEAIPESSLGKYAKELSLDRILVSDRIQTPITYGILKQVIILPKEMELSNKELLLYVLWHERVHMKYHDNLFKLLAIVTLCVHWYNPLVWVMWILCQRDLELRCDEQVLRAVGAENKKEYALTLLSMAEKNNREFAMSVGFGKKAIKERMEAIMNYKKVTIISAFVAVMVMAASLTAFITVDAKGSADQSKEYSFELSETNGDDKVYTVQQTMASAEYAGITKEREELYAPYKEVGISYDKEADRLLYGEQTIKMLLDKENELIYTVPEGEGYFSVTYEKNTMTLEEITGKEAQKIEKAIYKKQNGLGNILSTAFSTIFSTSFSVNASETTSMLSEESENRKDTVVQEKSDGKLTQEMKQNVQEYADRFSEYGVSVVIEDTDYQFYYKEEPVCFVADNKASGRSFSGSVYVNADHGKKGVVTIRNGSGEITGMKLLSEEETKEYNDRYW